MPVVLDFSSKRGRGGYFGQPRRYDAKKYYGRACRKGHGDERGTLRYDSNDQCVECKRLEWKKPKPRRPGTARQRVRQRLQQGGGWK